MIINFSESIKNLAGNSLKENGKEISIGNICANALLFEDKDDKMTGQEKLERYELAKKIFEKEKVDLTIEEIAKIKEIVGKYSSTLVVGQVYKYFENNIEKK